jgi:hypothetical protein
VKWQAVATWADRDGQEIEIVAPSVFAFDMTSLLHGLLEEAWGPLDYWTWIATHS